MLAALNTGAAYRAIRRIAPEIPADPEQMKDAHITKREPRVQQQPLIIASGALAFACLASALSGMGYAAWPICRLHFPKWVSDEKMHRIQTNNH